MKMKGFGPRGRVPGAPLRSANGNAINANFVFFEVTIIKKIQIFQEQDTIIYLD